MIHSPVLPILSVTLCLLISKHLLVEGHGLSLQDAESIRKWEIPSTFTKNNLRTGRKFKNLDGISDLKSKRTLTWGWKPDRRLRELDIEDDDESIKLDHNYKAFVEDDDNLNPQNEDQSLENMQKSANTRSFVGRVETDHLLRRSGSSNIFTDTKGFVPKQKMSANVRHARKRGKFRKSYTIRKEHTHRKHKHLSPVKSLKIQKRMVPDIGEAIKTARAAVAKIEQKRRAVVDKVDNRKVLAVPRGQTRAFASHGAVPVRAQFLAQNSLKEKELWESRQEALRLLQGAGVHLDENKKKMDNGDSSQFTSTISDHNDLPNRVHDKVQKKANPVMPVPLKAQMKKPKVNTGGQNDVKNVIGRGKVDNIKASKRTNVNENQKSKAAENRSGTNFIDKTNTDLHNGKNIYDKNTDLHNSKAESNTDEHGSTDLKSKADKPNADSELSERTKIESPELGRKEKLRIVPSNVARAVAMAMEQLRRDRMWGKVFVHVLPSGKLKVMVQETKKMEDE